MLFDPTFDLASVGIRLEEPTIPAVEQPELHEQPVKQKHESTPSTDVKATSKTSSSSMTGKRNTNQGKDDVQESKVRRRTPAKTRSTKSSAHGDGDDGHDRVKNMQHLSAYLTGIGKFSPKQEVDLWIEYKGYESEEPILRDSLEKFNLTAPDSKSTPYADIYELFKKHHQAEWIVSEVPELHKDRDHYLTDTPAVQHVIKTVLGFFAPSDGQIVDNLCGHFAFEVKIPYARMFYAIQNKMEVIHAMTYNTLLDAVIPTQKERDELKNSLVTIPIVKKKSDALLKWQHKSAPFAFRLIAFAFAEGIFFSSSFTFIYWLKRLNKYPALTTSNEWIARDEGLHTDHACALHHHLTHKAPQVYVHAMIREFVELEQEFARYCLLTPLMGMTADEMCTYIELVADRLLRQLGYAPIYNVTNPFEWMINISLQRKTNMHENRVTDYAKSVGNVH